MLLKKKKKKSRQQKEKTRNHHLQFLNCLLTGLYYPHKPPKIIFQVLLITCFCKQPITKSQKALSYDPNHIKSALSSLPSFYRLTGSKNGLGPGIFPIYFPQSKSKAERPGAEPKTQPIFGSCFSPLANNVYHTTFKA